MEQQEQQLQEHREQLDIQDQELKEHDAILDEQERRLVQQESLLEEHVPATQPARSGSPSSAVAAAATIAAEVHRGSAAMSSAGIGSTSSSAFPGLTSNSPDSRQPGRSSLSSITFSGSVGSMAGSPSASPQSSHFSSAKKNSALWDKVLELCREERFLEAYKQVIAEPEESCLLRLMQHTGPIVERLDAESNSRLIRRLIHILSSPSKEPVAASVEYIFSWLWQALKAGIHFTTSQVEDLASALQRVSAPQSPLPGQERAEAARLLQRVSALRRP